MSGGPALIPIARPVLGERERDAVTPPRPERHERGDVAGVTARVTELVSKGARLAYPIRDGVPVIINLTELDDADAGDALVQCPERRIAIRRMKRVAVVRERGRDHLRLGVHDDQPCVRRRISMSPSSTAASSE